MPLTDAEKLKRWYDLKETLHEDAIYCYVDGSTEKLKVRNAVGKLVPSGSGRSGVAFLIQVPPLLQTVYDFKAEYTESKFVGTCTSPVAELQAFALLLDFLESTGKKFTHPIYVFTDSAYCDGLFAKNWTAKENIMLVSNLRRRLKRFPTLATHHIYAHCGIVGNERVDVLASAAAKSQ